MRGLARALLQLPMDPDAAAAAFGSSLGELERWWQRGAQGTFGGVKPTPSSTSTRVLIIVLVACSVVALAAVAAMLWALLARRRRARHVEEAWRFRDLAQRLVLQGSRLHDVVLPAVVLGPAGALHIAVDDPDLEAAADADAGKEHGRRSSPGGSGDPGGSKQAGGGSEPGQPSAPAQALEVEGAMASHSGGISRGAEASSHDSSSHASGGDSSQAASGSAERSSPDARSLLLRVQCPQSTCVLAVADLTAADEEERVGDPPLPGAAGSLADSVLESRV